MDVNSLSSDEDDQTDHQAEARGQASRERDVDRGKDIQDAGAVGTTTSLLVVEGNDNVLENVCVSEVKL